MNQILRSIQDTEAPYGTVVLWWMGQMGLIAKAGDTVLSIDYFASPRASRQYEAPIPPEEMEGIDAFLGTHDHVDHIDHESWKVWARTNPGAKFIFPRAHMEKVLADGVGEQSAVGMNDGESVQVGAFTVHAVAAAHEFLDRDPQTGLFPHLQFVIEGNGVRIYHAGDTVRYEGMLARVKAFGDIDAALLPINGRDAKRYRRNTIGNMTFQEAADFAAEIGTRIVIPGHWDMFAHNSGDPYAFADYLDAKYCGKVECRIPKVTVRVIVPCRLR